VAAEHAASETVRRRLARFFDAARGPMMQTRLLVGMPPGGDHELGVFAFAVACRRAGQAVAYIGSNVPLESWMRIVRETAVPAIVLGAVTNEDAVAVNRVAVAIGMLEHPPVCFAGGPATIDPTVTSGAVQLPRSFDAAVAVVAEVTASRSGPRPR
jgi:methanogenic corrinoid protein MtbC1